MPDEIQDRPVVKPAIDDPAAPPVPEDEPARAIEEASRDDLAIRGAAAGGALGGSAGYAGGAMAGFGGAVGMQRTDAEEDAEETGEIPAPEEPGIEPAERAVDR